ncbi:G5 domain-containing protein [Couchioplanes caeruleus]|uniref:G5 domain-containing protein n=1 Tax=Couchioplanes caeruleus TaxID=56438 RepID=UPI0020C11808|nr:G5 domain-containing protein [Couchioplanes caeruleus]UQU63366.1 G5 domain-containing protein [Couchioplanes caeruleus]
MTYQSPRPPGPAGGPSPQGRLRRVWSGMSAVHRAALIIALIFLPCCGGLGGIVALGAAVDSPPAHRAADTGALAPVPEQGTVAPAVPVTSVSASAVPATTAASAVASATPAAATTTVPAAEVVKRTVTEKRAIPFKTRTVEDAAMRQGTRKVRVKGSAGVRTLTYEVSTVNGAQTGRRLVGSTVTRRPVTRVIAVGTREEPACDPNYSGCVPIASDVDCAGGSGNGPAYVDGVVRVIGTDIYDLDRDNDGYGCD